MAHRLCFNSRAPRGARQVVRSGALPPAAFQFTCPSRSTTADGWVLKIDFAVSIHVPLAEHDDMLLDAIKASRVSIHVPLAEHDMAYNAKSSASGSFNSRAPRGARPRYSGEEGV